MKHLLPVLCALLPLGAAAQKLQATQEPQTYTVGNKEVPLYASPADTSAAKVPFHLYANSTATVVGQYSPRWLVVKRQGFLYLASKALFVTADTPPILLDGTALPFDPDTKLISYQGVVEVPGVTKDQLYTRAYEWLAKTYRSANAVIQMQDKEAGRLIAKGATKVTIKGYDGGHVRHTITIYLKDGRYKYVLTDLTHDAVGARNITSAGPLEQPDGAVIAFGGKKMWDTLRHDADSDARRLVSDLQAAMTVKPGKDPSDF